MTNTSHNNNGRQNRNENTLILALSLVLVFYLFGFHDEPRPYYRKVLLHYAGMLLVTLLLARILDYLYELIIKGYRVMRGMLSRKK